MMNERQRWKEYQRLNKRLAAKPGAVKLKIDVVPIFEALLDWRMGKGTAQFLKQSFDTAMGSTDDKLTCFCCCKDWTLKRSPIGCLTVEFLGLTPEKAHPDSDPGLLAGICGECLDRGTPWIMKAVKRDFPYLDNVQTVSEPGEA